MKLFHRRRSFDQIIEEATSRHKGVDLHLGQPFNEDTNPELLDRAQEEKLEQKRRHEAYRVEELSKNEQKANALAKALLDLEPLEWTHTRGSSIRTKRPVAGGVYLIWNPYGSDNRTLLGTGGQGDERYTIYGLNDFADVAKKIQRGVWQS